MRGIYSSCGALMNRVWFGMILACMKFGWVTILLKMRCWRFVNFSESCESLLGKCFCFNCSEGLHVSEGD
jgi:hypothetical protein